MDRHPLTNAGKIALAEHKRAMAALAEQKKQAASDRPASKKARTLPPPDEMDADITATEKKERQKDLAASKKVCEFLPHLICVNISLLLIELADCYYLRQRSVTTNGISIRASP